MLERVADELGDRDSVSEPVPDALEELLPLRVVAPLGEPVTLGELELVKLPLGVNVALEVTLDVGTPLGVSLWDEEPEPVLLEVRVDVWLGVVVCV